MLGILIEYRIPAILPAVSPNSLVEIKYTSKQVPTLNRTFINFKTNIPFPNNLSINPSYIVKPSWYTHVVKYLDWAKSKTPLLACIAPSYSNLKSETGCVGMVAIQINRIEKDRAINSVIYSFVEKYLFNIIDKTKIPTINTGIKKRTSVSPYTFLVAINEARNMNKNNKKSKDNNVFTNPAFTDNVLKFPIIKFSPFLKLAVLHFLF